jgi:hypothetical protein
LFAAHDSFLQGELNCECQACTVPASALSFGDAAVAASASVQDPFKNYKPFGVPRGEYAQSVIAKIHHLGGQAFEVLHMECSDDITIVSEKNSSLMTGKAIFVAFSHAQANTKMYPLIVGISWIVQMVNWKQSSLMPIRLQLSKQQTFKSTLKQWQTDLARLLTDSGRAAAEQDMIRDSRSQAAALEASFRTWMDNKGHTL